MPSTFATASIASSGSQPNWSCAMASAPITADCFWSGGYLATSRSMRPRDSADRTLIPRPSSSRRRSTSRHVAQARLAAAAEGADLAGIRVLADFRRHHGAHRDVGEFGAGVVDDLVRGLGAADGAADEVAGAHLAPLGAVAQRPLAPHDEEHLLLAAVAVERARELAGLHHVVGVAQVLRAHQGAHAHRVGLELAADGRSARASARRR